jgi:energy-coupling factor transporter ATP-binding protein EcfA2
MGNGSVSASINADVLSWAKNQLAQWQHEALRRILNKGQLDASDYADVLKRAQFDLGMAVSPIALPDHTLTAVDLPTVASSKGKVVLRALRNIEHVNSLKTGTVVTFGPQLTVIYGENGSGKSGYARILKRVGRCASRAVEDILPNVYASPTGTPARATIDVEVGGSVIALSWSDGQPPSDELRHVAVFDSKCALSYLGPDNQISFVPSVIDALRLLSDATDEIRRRLVGVAGAAAPSYPAALSTLVSSETTVGRALGLLSAATDPKTLVDLAKWDTGIDEQAVVSAQTQLEELRAASPVLRSAQLSSEKQSLLSLSGMVERVSAALDASKIEELKEYDAVFAARNEAHKLLAHTALADSRIDGVGTDAWRSLVEAAHKFSVEHAYKGQEFPSTKEGAVCVLCQQGLTPEATSRLTTFRDFLRDDATAQLDAARDTRDKAVAAMKTALGPVPTELARVQSEFESRATTLWEAAQTFLASATTRVAAIEEALENRSWDDVPPLDTAVKSQCESRLTANQGNAASASTEIEVERRIAALMSELAELNARKRLAGSLQIVQGYLDALKHHTALKVAADSIATKGITFKAKTLYGTYVTGAFRKSVAQNMQRLGLYRAGIAIEEKSGKGKVLHAVKLDGAKIAAQPSAVLSEGERTAISLSYFLSDLGVVDETSVVVFDDPVTSLDHRIREGAVKALVALAKDRQVVVFTHDLALFHELVSKANVEQVGVVTHHVESFNHTVGVIQGSTPWDAMSVDQRIGELEKHAAKAKDAAAAADGEGYKQQVGRFYSRLRATWERSVEELLFNKVVSRYERAVQTLRLDGVVVDKEAIATVYEAMTKCSAVTDAHDHAAAASVPTPTTAEMTNDLEMLRAFVQSQKTKRKAAEKANAHLKGKA